MNAKTTVTLALAMSMATTLCAGVKTKTDKETGAAMHIITDRAGVNTIGYPTCRTWSKDGKSLFIESSRSRPDGTTHPRERQLLKVDTADGKVTHLATLVAEDTAKYGKAHRAISSHYHADYSPYTEVMVYYDMTGHNMYLLDVKTGKQKRILHEPEGTIGDPPGISTDGKRIVYYVIYPAVENRYFTDLNSVIYVLDVNPTTLEAVGEPRMVVAFPGRKGPKYEENPRDQVHVNHCQINPVNNDHISYAHEFHGVNVDVSLLKTRCWQVMADGSGNKPFVPQEPGEGQTHEIFGPKGKCIYLVTFGKVYSVDFESGRKKLVFDAGKYGGCHVTVSPDERWAAVDMFVNEGNDEHGNPISGILLVDMKTGKQKVLCRFSRLPKHPGHPHPNFSPDGTKIAFTMADGPNTQVAWVDVPKSLE